MRILEEGSENSRGRENGDTRGGKGKWGYKRGEVRIIEEKLVRRKGY